MAVRFVLNGAPVAAEVDDPHVTLLQWLRASGRTGTKEGCAEGECGACAVAFVGEDASGRTRFEPVNSCLVPLWTVEGRTVVTVEGVARDGALHPVQSAMVDRGGSQCGYCTPGFVVSLFCEYYRPGRAGFDAEAIGGNLCRCTGYRPIADVARALPFPASDDPWLETLRAAVPSLASPSPPSPRFERPGSLEGVFARLAASPGAVLIAGGTDLMVYANQRYERWPALVSLEGVPELRDFTVEDGAMVIGAGVPLAAIEERLRGTGAAPALEALLPLFSSRLIRNRATLGGSLVTASPIGDAAPVLLALDADVVIASAAGMRRLPLTDFFVGYRKTVLAPGDVVVSVHLPLPAPRHQRFYKVSKRVMDDISTVAAAFALDLDGEGRVARLRAAFGGVAATPVRALDAERAAVGRRWDAETIAALGPALDALGTPMTDHRGSAAYRRAMPRRLLERFFFEVKTAEAPAGEARP